MRLVAPRQMRATTARIAGFSPVGTSGMSSVRGSAVLALAGRDCGVCRPYHPAGVGRGHRHHCFLAVRAWSSLPATAIVPADGRGRYRRETGQAAYLLRDHLFGIPCCLSNVTLPAFSIGMEFREKPRV